MCLEFEEKEKKLDKYSQNFSRASYDNSLSSHESSQDNWSNFLVGKVTQLKKDLKIVARSIVNILPWTPIRNCEIEENTSTGFF